MTDTTTTSPQQAIENLAPWPTPTPTADALAQHLTDPRGAVIHPAAALALLHDGRLPDLDPDTRRRIRQRLVAQAGAR